MSVTAITHSRRLGEDANRDSLQGLEYRTGPNQFHRLQLSAESAERQSTGRKLLAILGHLLVTLLAALGIIGDDQETTGLVGCVRNAETEEPIAGADVCIRTTGGRKSWQTTTDDHGRFKIVEFDSWTRTIDPGTRPELAVDVRIDGKPAAVQHDAFDWDAYDEADYVFEVFARPADDCDQDDTVPDEPVDDRQFRVRGTIHNADGTPTSGHPVRVFARTLRNERMLGSTTTDAAGRYSIQYETDGLGNRAPDGPNVLVRVYSSRESRRDVLAESAVRFNAGVDETIDLEIDATSEDDAQTSEYHRLMALLRPRLTNTHPATLTDEDIEFLEQETGIENRPEEFPDGTASIRLLHEAARLSQQSDSNRELLYGLGRQGIDLSAEAIVDREPETLKGALEAAADEDIISLEGIDVADRLADLIEQLRPDEDQDPEEPHYITATLRVLEAESNDPRVNHEIVVSGPKTREVKATTDEGGRATVRLEAPPEQPAANAVRADGSLLGGEPEETDESGTESAATGPQPPSALEVAISVFGRSEEPIYTETHTLEDEDKLTIYVPSQSPGRETETSLADLESTGQISIDDQLTSVLGDRTLADVRAAGGVESLVAEYNEHTDGDPIDIETLPDIERVNSLATLTLSIPPAIAETIYERGYESPLAIAAETNERFCARIATEESGITTAQADRIYRLARAQQAFLDDVVLVERREWANRRRSNPAANLRGGRQ